MKLENNIEIYEQPINLRQHASNSQCWSKEVDELKILLKESPQFQPTSPVGSTLVLFFSPGRYRWETTEKI